MINLNPEHFARAQSEDYDPVFGQAQPEPAKTPERERIDNAYLCLVSGPGAVVLQDLITKYVAKPIFDSARDAAKGYERNGEANVVRHMVDQMHAAQRRLQEGR